MNNKKLKKGIGLYLQYTVLFLLAVMFCFGLKGKTAFAAEGTEVLPPVNTSDGFWMRVITGNDYMSSEDVKYYYSTDLVNGMNIGGGTVTFDDNSKTLTLDNVTLKGVYINFKRNMYSTVNTLKVIGNNSLTSYADPEIQEPVIGGKGNNLQIIGGGILNIDQYSNYNSIFDLDTLTVDNTNLNLKSHCSLGVNVSKYIQNGGDVKIVGTVDVPSEFHEDAAGLVAVESINITEGNLSIASQSDTYSIISLGTFKSTKGEISVKNTKGPGILSVGNMDLASSNIDVLSTGYSPLYELGDINANNSKIKLTANADESTGHKLFARITNLMLNNSEFIVNSQGDGVTTKDFEETGFPEEGSVTLIGKSKIELKAKSNLLDINGNVLVDMETYNWKASLNGLLDKSDVYGEYNKGEGSQFVYDLSKYTGDTGYKALAIAYGLPKVGDNSNDKIDVDNNSNKSANVEKKTNTKTVVEKTTQKISNEKSPKTGDINGFAIYGLLALISLAGTVIVLKRKRNME
ncbi:MAG: LPXTG cell wall anchor domain-containing protein [Lachnospiraceae bacterium]|jgi:LPXTG-motif cell wall-anchored protein|nr:LPXTG cell wall anchor domain-containing protein [Lachnospiraceae bacterium]